MEVELVKRVREFFPSCARDSGGTVYIVKSCLLPLQPQPPPPSNILQPQPSAGPLLGEPLQLQPSGDLLLGEPVLQPTASPQQQHKVRNGVCWV